jgi:hypothetical protein
MINTGSTELIHEEKDRIQFGQEAANEIAQEAPWK